MKKKTKNVFEGKCHGDLFTEVRQRVAAFKLYLKFYETKWTGSVDEKLDAAYRFLYGSVNEEFIKFCAKYEKMDYDKYVKMLLEP